MQIDFGFIFFALSLMATGYTLRGIPKLKDRGPHFLNRWILLFALPATVLLNVSKVEVKSLFNAKVIPLILTPWIQFGIAFLIFRALAKQLKLSRVEGAMLTLVVGLGNTSFMGFPILRALLGESAIAYAAILDQLGTFFVFSSVATLFAAQNSSVERHVRNRLSSFLRYIPFLSLILALILAALKVQAPISPPILPWLSKTLTPAAMLSCGLQFDLDGFFHRDTFKNNRRILGIAFILKLLIIPTMISLVWSPLYDSRDPIYQVIVLESAMASMFSALILAKEYDLMPKFANWVILITVVASLVTVPLWDALLLWVASLF